GIATVTVCPTGMLNPLAPAVHVSVLLPSIAHVAEPAAPPERVAVTPPWVSPAVGRLSSRSVWPLAKSAGPLPPLATVSVQVQPVASFVVPPTLLPLPIVRSGGLGVFVGVAVAVPVAGAVEVAVLVAVGVAVAIAVGEGPPVVAVAVAVLVAVAVDVAVASGTI